MTVHVVSAEIIHRSLIRILICIVCKYIYTHVCMYIYIYIAHMYDARMFDVVSHD